MKLLKEYLYFTASERRGLLVLGVLLLLLLFLSLGWFYPDERLLTPAECDEQAASVAACEAFWASVHKDEPASYATEKSRRAVADTPVELTFFDPNKADSADFCRLGLPSWMARNILRYRRKGGVFRKPEDFRKVYGLTDVQYRTLLPFITIASDESVNPRPMLYQSQVVKADSMPLYPSVEKYPAGTLVDLNRADTTELKKIPGVGSGIARMIVGYRERLGGYYSVKQLREIQLNDSLLAPWFRVDSTAIRRINLNKAGVTRLRSHPYINFYQAKLLVDYRREKGIIRSLKPFVLCSEFQDGELERIAPYVCFE